MQSSTFNRFPLCGLLLAGAAGALMISTAASAQPYDAYGPGPYGPGTYAAGPTEEVIVAAPRFRSERTPLNGPLETVSLSVAVPYNDLDLTTRYGARVLKARVRQAAWNVCGQLRDAYPVHQLNYGAPCYRTAMHNALVRADEAISDARLSYAYGYDENGPYGPYGL